MLAHSFDRFYVVTKYILPSISALKFWTINVDETCDYLKEENGCNSTSKEYISDLRIYFKKTVPFVHNNKEQISCYNWTVHNILMNEISLILPNLSSNRREKYNQIINIGIHRFSI